MEAVAVAVIVGLLSIIGQWWLKRQDYQRQDEVARRVAEVATAAAATVTKVDEIHVMINQQRTDAAAHTEQLVNALAERGIPIPRDESLHPSPGLVPARGTSDVAE